MAPVTQEETLISRRQDVLRCWRKGMKTHEYGDSAPRNQRLG